MGAGALLETHIPGREPDARGKVRDLYDLGDTMLIVATDRLSAFDWVNPVGIPDKGVILTQIALYWFDQVADIMPDHLISADVKDFPAPFTGHADQLAGRSMLVRKCEMLPIEFVVRGFLAGSGWKEYRERGTVCEIALPPGLTESAQLPEPIYTPATKAESGHDINIHPDEAGRIIGEALNAEGAAAAIALYERGRSKAAECGMILCDTKFEFGLYNGKLMLCDEILTPDSSRYWPADGYAPGGPQPSFDKQFVRDYLETTGWDKNSPQPPLPDEIVDKTRSRYMEAFTRLTGRRDL
ncbi:MAG: phosphoribosylaminoimidazolesuccinocarboxamide synthase [Candidatus Hydrogenedens sp.]|nr:phosphoribosylaminoimidazolesuccinocarboxamide synthase [Candidatus Hydrogenedens sp.]